MEMPILVSPNQWSCMPTALAMLLRKSVDEVLTIIGHDGSMILWPDEPEPYCRRSFCINEIVFAALECGFGLVEIAPTCQYHPYGVEENSTSISVPDKDWEERVLSQYDCLFLGEGHSGVSHAVAWSHDRHLIYDPNGSRYNAEFFRRDLIYGMVRVGS